MTPRETRDARDSGNTGQFSTGQFRRRASDQPKHIWPFVLLACVGFGVWLLVIVLHVYAFFTGTHYDLNLGVIILSGLMGFVGFWGIDRSKTKEGLKVAADTAVQIINVLPGFRGRRASDNTVAVVQTPEATTIVAPVVVPEETTTIVASTGADAPAPDDSDGGRGQ